MWCGYSSLSILSYVRGRSTIWRFLSNMFQVFRRIFFHFVNLFLPSWGNALNSTNAARSTQKSIPVTLKCLACLSHGDTLFLSDRMASLLAAVFGGWFLVSTLMIPLEERVEQRSVLKFLVKSGLSPIQCWERLHQVHGQNCLSKNHVRVWHKRFRNGWTDTKDQKRSGRRKSVRVPATIQAVNQAIQGNRQSTMRELADEFSVSKSSIHNIVCKDLKLSRIAPKFIPKDLTQAQRDTRRQVSEQNIQLVKDNPDLLQSVITCDESWVSVFQLETKRASSEWHPRGTRLDRPRKPLKQRTERKSMLTAFFDRNGIVHAEFKDPGVHVTAESYCATIRRFKESVRRKRPALWRRNAAGERSFFLLHDNASPHTADDTVELLQQSGIPLLDHPPYSPDLAPCDYFLFPRLKNDLSGHRFPNIQALQAGVTRAF